MPIRRYARNVTLPSPPLIERPEWDDRSGRSAPRKIWTRPAARPDPAKALLSCGFEQLLQYGLPERRLVSAPLADGLRRQGNQCRREARGLRAGFRQPLANAVAPDRAEHTSGTAARMVLGEGRLLGDESRLRSSGLCGLGAPDLLRVHVLPQRISEYSGRRASGRHPGNVSAAAAGRNRLPAVPRARTKPCRQSLTRRFGASCASRDCEPGPPESGSRDGGLPAMPSGNIESKAAPRDRPLRSRSVLVCAGTASRRFRSGLRSRAG